MRKLFTMLLGAFLLLCGFDAHAQRTVTGKVEAADGSPLPGASVLIKGTTVGAIADAEGGFTVEIPDGDETILVVSFFGKTTREVEVGSQSSLIIVMQEDAVSLEEVVLTGYGTQKKGDLSTAISSIKSEEIAIAPVATLEQAMQGRAAGVLISNSSGQPGAALRVQVRGATSITASSEPLYVVDGIPMTQDDNSQLFTGGYGFNSLADLNPNDIESIEILKDASAAAIYGSRGANGVVLITTKRGSQGKAKITFDAYTGFQSPTKVIDMMNSREFIEMMDEAAFNDGFGPNYFSTDGPGFNIIGDPNDPDLNDTDWYGELLKENAPMQNYTLSVTGGNQAVSYYISGGYFDQEGFQKGTNFDRLSFRANLDFKASEKLKIGTQAYVSRSNSISTIGDNSLYGVMINALAADPTMPVFEDDGSYANPFSYYSWWAFENPVASTQLYERSTRTNRFLGTVYAEYELIDNLKIRSSWSVDYQYLQDSRFYPSTTLQSIRSGNTGEGQFGSNEAMTWLNENTITYTTTLAEKHNLTGLAGFTMQETTNDRAGITAQNFPNEFLGNLALAADVQDAFTNGTSWGLTSFLGRVNYNYDNKYYVTASVRADGSSRFGEDNQYGVFPSASVAWRVSGEPFMSNVGFVNDLKLRASYGLTGNQDGIGNFTSRALWSSTDQYLGQGGAAPSIMGNGALGWESTSQLDIGLDLSLFNGRIGFTFDYFDKVTTDLLLATDVPGYTGFTSVTRNIGEVRNTGLEFALSTVNVDLGGFTWRTDFNISTIENEVTKLEQNPQLFANHILQEGKPLGSFFLIPFEGVNPETGNSIFTDVNGDGAINSDDRAIPQEDGDDLNIWPNFFGGLNNTFSFKGFEASIFLQFSQGNYLWNHSRYAQEQVGWSFDFGGFYLPYGNNTQRVVDGRWKQPGDQTDIPRASLGRRLDPTTGDVIELPQNWQENSDQWLEDASYLRIKNVELAYNLPQTWISSIGLSSVRIYARAQNLVTWTDYLGVDPEVSSNGEGVLTPGEDYGGLGQAKTYLFGINIGL